MPRKSESHLYEYAIIRYLPKVEREEFVNVGLIMMCKKEKWLKVKIKFDQSKILALSPDIECGNIIHQLESFNTVAQGDDPNTVSLEIHERFRWLTAVRSACITTSRPHPGMTYNLEQTFDRLFQELVE